MFYKFPFYAELPPRLQQNLVFHMLKEQADCLQYFFYDSLKEQKCDLNFMQAILTHLNNKIYVTGSLIAEQGKKMDSMVFFEKGKGHLFSYH